ncbi:MAG: Gfo/Idh/MocA family oxidoreductase [Tepidisphaeraceae bacterium]
MPNRVRVAIVGLGFGAEFIPIYQTHPDAEMVAICQRNPQSLNQVGEQFAVAKRFTSFDELIKDSSIDAVHINSPIPDHAWMSVKALQAGKHVACTVPMGTTADECKQIVEAQRKSGKTYMMMETVVYSREYLFAKDLYDRGTLGKIQFLRGSHQQDMDGWPNYWPGLPPMWYATHCVSPCLAILSDPASKQIALAESVVCHGSGRIREALVKKYNSPFAIETATFKIKGTDVVAEVTRSLFDAARQYRESFDVTGSNVSFEWQQVEGEDPVLHMRGLPEGQIPRRVKVPDFAGRLPEPIRKFTGAIHDATHLSFLQGAGHGGSHPHLTHQFLMAVLGKQPAFPDAPTSANWTCVGICAHDSAMKGGERVALPSFS